MNLKEAKKILNDNGYKVELNEDLRKAWAEVKDSVSDALVGGMRKLSPKVQQFIQDTIPLGAALKEAGTIYGFRVEKEEGFYKLTVRNKHTSTAPDFLYVKGFRGNIEVNIDGEGWTTKTIKVHSKKELMDLLKTVIYNNDYEQPEAAAKGWFKMPQNESTITEIRKYNKDNLTMNLREAKKILKRNGYIFEDTDDWDEADMPIGTPKQRADRVNKHSSFRDLDHKYTDAANFNIKNLFDGVEKELKKVYKKVEMEASDYDDEDKSQIVSYYYTFKKKEYDLKVIYYDEDDVIKVQLFADDWYGYERDDFSVTTIDDAIKQIIKFVHYNTL